MCVRIRPGELKSPTLDYNSPTDDEEAILRRRGARVRVITTLRSGRSRVCNRTVPVFPLDNTK